MSELVPLSKEEVDEIIDFCKDYEEPYKSTLFRGLLEHTLGIDKLGRARLKEEEKETELLPDLPEETVKKVMSICRQVDCDLRELFKVYKFDPEKVTLVAFKKVLGENDYDIMRSVCYLKGCAANLVYGTQSISSGELRDSCKEAGVIRGLANFAAALKADEVLKNAYKSSEKELTLAPRVVSGGINLLGEIVKKMRSPEE